MSALISPEAERTVIGSILGSQQALYEAMAILRAEDFSGEQDRIIWRAAGELSELGRPVDLLTLSDFLSEKNLLVKAGGYSNLAEMSSVSVPGRNIEFHAKIVLEKSKRRRARAAAERLINSTEDATVPTSLCLSQMQECLLELEADAMDSQAVRLVDFIGKVFDNLKTRSETGGLVGMPTGIETLDFQTTGLRPQELWIVGAMPGRGKTSLGLQAAIASATVGNPVMFFSLEMSRMQIGERILSATSSVAAAKIREPRYIGKDGWPQLVQTINDVADWPLYVDDSDSLDVQQLVARATLAKRQFGIKLFVVDYIKLVRAQGKELRERVSAVAEALRRFAKREHVSVIALSQLSRPKDRDINSRPTMLDLKESGDLEAAAHVILLLFMPLENDRPTGYEEIIIGKQREGAMGPVPVKYNSLTLQFDPRSEDRV